MCCQSISQRATVQVLTGNGKEARDHVTSERREGFLKKMDLAGEGKESGRGAEERSAERENGEWAFWALLQKIEPARKASQCTVEPPKLWVVNAGG